MKIYSTRLEAHPAFYLPVQAQLYENDEGILNLNILFGKRPIKYQDWTPINTEKHQYWVYAAKDMNAFLINDPEINNNAAILITPGCGLDIKDEASYAIIPIKFEDAYLVTLKPKLDFELQKTKPSIKPEDIFISIGMYQGASKIAHYSLKGVPEESESL